MQKYESEVIWCREKPFCVSWEWKFRRWFPIGFYRFQFDGLRLWSLNLGPLAIHNDFIPEEKEKNI